MPEATLRAVELDPALEVDWSRSPAALPPANFPATRTTASADIATSEGNGPADGLKIGPVRLPNTSLAVRLAVSGCSSTSARPSPLKSATTKLLLTGDQSTPKAWRLQDCTPVIKKGCTAD